MPYEYRLDRYSVSHSNKYCFYILTEICPLMAIGVFIEHSIEQMLNEVKCAAVKYSACLGYLFHTFQICLLCASLLPFLCFRISIIYI